MKKIPFLGAACASVGTIFLNRDNREEAYASLKNAAQRIVDEDLQVLISPEGTRSQDGRLGRFKTGAFHLAYEAKVPVLPIVIYGSARLWPRSQLAPSAGQVTIDVMPEFMVNAGDTETLRTIANTLRERYLEVLAHEHAPD